MLLQGRKDNRLTSYDYSQIGYYFVTICTKRHVEWFEKIENEQMILNQYGEIVKKQWLWLAEHFPYVSLDKWILMPNHLHGIVVIDSLPIVGTGRDLSLHQLPQENGIKIKPLSDLIGAFKTTSSKMIHQQGLGEFLWQRSFYDHIVRDESSLNKIREYISNNPINWGIDRIHKTNFDFSFF